MKIGFMINSVNLIDNAKALIESQDHDWYVMAINDVFDQVKDILPNVHHVRVFRYTKFPFYDKICAAARAEELGVDIWMDIDSLFLQEIELTDDCQVAAVDQKGIGREEKDEFWSILFKYFSIDPDYTIDTTITKEEILPYFNMGFVVNFKHFNKVLQEMTYFLKKGTFDKFFEDYKYKVFLHQAIFSCLVEKHYDWDFLDDNINHPMHLDDNIKDKWTIRYDTYFNENKNEIKSEYDLSIDWIYE